MARSVPGDAYVGEALLNNPEFTDVYYLPSEGEYRLIYIDPTALPSDPEGISSFLLRDEEEGKPVILRVAIIRPEEVRVVPLPKIWEQTWDDAIKLTTPKRAA